MASILKQFIAASLVFIGNGFCADEPACAMKQWTDSGLPNPSSRPLAQSRNIVVFGDALYWYTSEVAEWAITYLTSGNSETATFQGVSFDWAPGFRVGFGANLEHDQWDTQIYYTWFDSSAADHIDSGSGAIESDYLGPVVADLGTFQTAQMNWRLHLNIIDWDIGRSFFVSKDLLFRPFFGVKWGWIHQAIHTSWQNPEFDFLGVPILLTADDNLKNNFFGGGPKGGVQGKWIVGHVQRHYFSLIGDFGAAYMWGNWKIKDHFIDSLVTNVTTSVGNRSFGSLMVQALMGFGWDFNFSDETSHFAMKLGYEIQDWIDQYQLFDHFTGTNSSDLILQGLTAEFRFDF